MFLRFIDGHNYSIKTSGDLTESKTRFPFTFFKYKNITSNRFTVFAIKIYVKPQ